MSSISFEEAFNRVGLAIYGSAWITAMTERERWLYRQYVEGVGCASSSIAPGRITYVCGNRSYANVPLSPSLLEEVERALDRKGWHDQQTKEVFDWLEENGFGPNSESFDSDEINCRLREISTVQNCYSDFIYKTGSPGRTSPIQFVEREHKRRIAAKAAHQKLKDEAIYLHGWCEETHPTASTPAATSIENRIRRAHKVYLKPHN